MKILKWLIVMGLIPLSYFIVDVTVFLHHQTMATHELKITAHDAKAPWFGYFYRTQNKPRVLLIGDSISGGYSDFVAWILRRDVLVDSWVTALSETDPALISELQQVLAYRQYDIIHFNCGLHGLDVPVEVSVERVQTLLHAIQKAAPQAQLVWASTTPVTVEKQANTLDAVINTAVIEKNKHSEKLMKQQGVIINDLYGLMQQHLALGLGDRLHWGIQGYWLMAKQTAEVLDDLIKPQYEPNRISEFYFLAGVFSTLLAMLLFNNLQKSSVKKYR